jgi:hypothetical protein
LKRNHEELERKYEEEVKNVKEPKSRTHEEMEVVKAVKEPKMHPKRFRTATQRFEPL